MAQTRGQKLHNQYVRGLITEATALTFPPNASYDELNMELLRNGSRRRRRGIKREDGASNANEPSLAELGISSINELVNEQITIFKWVSVGGDPDLSLLVVQVGSYLHFFDASVSPIVDGFRSEIINLDTYNVVVGPVGTDKCQFATGKGKLFVSHPKLKPFFVSYNRDTFTLEDQGIDLRIRDFEGVDDGLEVDERPSTLSVEHNYNLRNQGWYEGAVYVLFPSEQKSQDPILAFNQYTAFYGPISFG